MEMKQNKKTMKGCMITLWLIIVCMRSITYGYEYSDYIWNEYNGHQYALTLDYCSWTQAQAWAEEVGGHLVTISNAAENEFIAEMAKYSNGRPSTGHDDNTYNGVWMGLFTVDEVSKTVAWVSGEPVSYTNYFWPLELRVYNPHWYIAGNLHDNPSYRGKWGCNPVHDTDPAKNIRGMIEIDVEPLLVVDVDIKPGSCPNPLNVTDKGVLPVAVLGSEGFDVTTIDIASIRLEGVAPIRSNYEDVATPVYVEDEDEYCECTTEGPDGYLDLTLKFKVQEVVAVIGEVNNGDLFELSLTGVLTEVFEGTPIKGTDCVVVIAKGSE